MRAAHNILEACAQTDTIEKFVFTSSATAIIWGHHENDQNSASMVLDERHWSDINFCRKYKVYMITYIKFRICKCMQYSSFIFIYFFLESTNTNVKNCT